MRNFKLFAQLLALTSLLFFAACQQEEIVSPNSAIESRKSLLPTSMSGYYGLGPSNELYRFSLRPAYMEQGIVLIKGLRPGEIMLAIDTRPMNRALYGVSNMSRIYLIDPISGFTKPLSQASFTPAIDGVTVGFDFNAMTGMISLMTDKGQNLVIHPYTGQVIGFGNTTMTGINGLAFINTTMYAMDGASGMLYLFDQFGNAKPVGLTGLTIIGEGGFDSKNGITLGVFLASGVVHNSSPNPDDLNLPAYRLYRYDLSTGQVSNLGIVKPMIGLAAQ